MALAIFLFGTPWWGSALGQATHSLIVDSLVNDLDKEDSRMLQIEGVQCECCVCFIAVKAREIPGVKSVTDLPSLGMVVIEYYESKVTAKALIEAVRQLGFKVKFNRGDSTAADKKRRSNSGGAI